jgi:predicted secreted hydrolase
MGDGLVTYKDSSSGENLGYDFYYSRTRIAVAGTISANGKTEPTIGQSWFDHEWGMLPQKVSWQWYSIQLDNGEDIMAYTISKTKDEPFIAGGVTLVDSTGCRTDSYDSGELTMSSTGLWVSPHTGVSFPTAFNLFVPSKNMNLVLQPVIQDQEIYGGPLKYWEGAVNVSGTENGTVVNGTGYVELVGY